MSQPSDFEALIAYCKAKGACPRAFEWSVMFELLDGFGREEKHEQVPWPLILSAWHFSSDGEKHERFLLHLHIANERGLLPAVGRLMRLGRERVPGAMVRMSQVAAIGRSSL